MAATDAVTTTNVDELTEEFEFDGIGISPNQHGVPPSKHAQTTFLSFLHLVADKQGWKMAVSRCGKRVTREFISPCKQHRFKSKEHFQRMNPPPAPAVICEQRPKRQRREPSINACTIAPSLAAKIPPTPISQLISKASKILVLLGAGVSTSAGLPDFRSKLVGLYSLPSDEEFPPEVLFDNELFDQDPQPFFRFASKTFLPQVSAAKPTLTHHFVQSLSQSGKLLRCYTQNVDGLELSAGVSREHVVQVHGTLTSATCMECGWQTSHANWWKTPECQKCDNFLKPDMTFFGQHVEFTEQMRDDCNKCDLLLVMGTSLSVLPVSRFLQLVSPSRVKYRVWINRQMPPKSKQKFFNNIQLGECDDIVVK